MDEARHPLQFKTSVIEGEMSKSVNKVILLGNVGQVEVKSSSSGTLVANVSLATNDRYQDAQGNWQDRAEWHNLVAFKRTAEIVRDYVHKGSKIYVEGKLQTQSWEKDGVKHYRTKILVNDLVLLSAADSKPATAPKTVDEQLNTYSPIDEDIPF